jgi:hypothetical protein
MQFRVDNSGAAYAADAARAPLDLIHTLGTVEVPPAFMVKRFGKHDGGDGDHTSGGWTFVGEAGEVFTVNEMRRTTLWHGPGSGAPTVREFWRQCQPVRLDIGGYDNTDWQAFRKWLRAEYRAFARAQARGAGSVVRPAEARGQLRCAEELHDRAYLVAFAEDQYSSLSFSAKEVFRVLGDHELGGAIDPGLPARLDEALERQVRPAQKSAWADYLALFGCALGDRARVRTPGMPVVALALSELTFYHRYREEPFAWATGGELKRDGQPGKRVAVAKLQPGKTKVTVL